MTSRQFDYSGSQCLKALREEGIETVLVNPNIATIQTDPRLAGKVYLVPVQPEFVEEVIKRERPDGILLHFGGQTALNCGVQLAESGVLEKHNVKVIGTPIKAIRETEDRELFRQAMIGCGVAIPRSRAANSVDQACGIASEIGYPIIIRPAYTLGGKGSAIVRDENQLRETVSRAIAQSMIGQVLVEEYVGHWKEVEYEVMRDSANNCLIVCNMENFDPMGVHTGDSIVVAPSQTLTNREYHLLRSASIRVIQSIGIVGECNIQWALHPGKELFYAIEVNARMSRSSALASKATGYPLAYIAAKLAIGYTLPELINKVTGVTTACFEPALDYVVVKIPRWDLQKFRNVDRHLGPQMKSVGEVMAIGRCFEEALQNAVRSLDLGKIGLVGNDGELDTEPIEDIRNALANPTDERLLKVVKAMKRGLTVNEISHLSGIDAWFLHKIEKIIRMEEELRQSRPEDERFSDLLREAKRVGFSDKQVAKCVNSDEERVRGLRKKAGIVPVVKQIDTLGAEWPAATNYLYVTYGGDEDDVVFDSKGRKVVVLGAGVFRIGSSVEFDWCGVNTVWALKNRGIDEAIMVNYNPETVSTDYDMSDKLYFEDLSFERIMDICDKERPEGVIVSVGGQIPNNLALKIARAGVRILGTSAGSIDTAEDRSKFSRLLDDLGIPQPKWSILTTIEDVKKAARNIGYPILVRPSYVLSGSAMRVAHRPSELEEFLQLAAKVSPERPVVISKFIQAAREVEVDAVSDGENVIIGGVIEHVERAGVHSGDATMTVPPQNLSTEVFPILEDYAIKIARALQVKGPFNIQYLVKDGTVYVIECNLRASRSMPYVSKTVGVNLMDLATSAMLGEKLSGLGISQLPPVRHTGVKVPQFSFMRLTGADPVLGVEMLSTGEVACLGENFPDALIKALLSAEFRVPPRNGSVLVSVGGDKRRIIPIARALHGLGYRIFATEHTADALSKAGIEGVTVLHKVKQPGMKPNILDHLLQRKIDLVINIPTINGSSDIIEDEYTIRRLAVEYNIPVITTFELAGELSKALRHYMLGNVTVKPLDEYIDLATWGGPLQQVWFGKGRQALSSA